MPLANALELLNAGDRAGALDALLEAWRRTRAGSVADVIDIVSDDITRSLAPIEGKTHQKFQEAWLDVAGEDRASDVGRLLATFSREPCTQIPERMARFEARDQDPRVARELWTMIGRCPCTSTPNFPMWTRLFKLLVDIGDVRMHAPLEAKLGEKRRRPHGTFFEVLYPRIEKTIAGIAVPPALSKEDAAIVKKLDARARALLKAPPPSSPMHPDTKLTSKKKKKGGAAQSEEELVALVLADPEADGPRLVYGDWLLERGNPRGEVITLQFKARSSPTGLSKSELKRERDLLKAHARKWLGAIEPVIARDGIVFERGFLSACTVAFRTSKQRETLMSNPMWSTVKRLHGAPAMLVMNPVMRSLRFISGMTQEEIATLASAKTPLAIESVRFGIGEAPDQDQQALIAEARALPKLREMIVDLPMVVGGPPPAVLPTDLGKLLRGNLAKERLERPSHHLRVEAYAAYGVFDEARPDLGAWLDAAKKCEKLTKMSFDVQNTWEVTLTRSLNANAAKGKKQSAWSLCIGGDGDEVDLGTLLPMFRNVSAKTFERIEIKPDSGNPPKARLVKAVAAYQA